MPARDYYDWIDREARDARREREDVRMSRFLLLEPELEIVRVTLDRDETCAICRDPLFFGEAAYQCQTTFQTGCCEEHCWEAAEAKLQLMGAEA